MKSTELALTVALVVAAILAATTTPAFAREAKVPVWKDEHAHGFVGCLAQEAASPHYFDLVNAKTDEGASVGTLRLTGHFLGIDDPAASLNKRVQVTGVYVGDDSTHPGTSTILLTDDAHLLEGECPSR
jgi:hypothetical protein